MNTTDRLRIPAFFIVVFFPGLLFGWWAPGAENTFWILLCFMFMWLVFWGLFFFSEPFTGVEIVDYLVREAQAATLGLEFALTILLLLLNASLRTVLFINGFSYALFALSSIGIILYHAELINQLKNEGDDEHDLY